jgi:predicted ATP-binding protein involved in virulence
MNKRNGSIWHLEQNAKKNDIAAVFQLYQNYKNGEFVEKNQEKEMQYLQQLQALIAGSRLSLQNIDFINYKRLEKFSCKFDRELTVIIGNNGAGKTTILEAVVKLLSWINGDMTKSRNSARPLQDDDINVNAEEYAEISAQFCLNEENPFSASLARPKPGYENKIESSLADLRLMGEIYRTINAHTALPLPLFAYYSVDRATTKSIGRPVRETTQAENNLGRFEVCRNALDAGDRPGDFIRWYIELDNISNGQKNKDSDQLEKEIYLLEKLASELVDGEAKKQLMLNLQVKKELLLQQKKPDATYAKRLETVKKAIALISPEVGTLELDRSSGRPELYFISPHSRVNFNKISKGQQTMVALVADLALRLTKLNPQLENALHGPGIVMIDEIELHLHPGWQQTILASFKEIFPYIQLIVTTHSPFILSTVKPRSIRGLIINESGEIVLHDGYAFSEGANVQQVVEDILEVSARPTGNPFVEKLEKYLSLIREDKWDSEEAIGLRMELDRWGGQHETALLDADMDIQLRQFRRAKR